MMSDAIQNFAKQLSYEPVIEGKKLPRYNKYILLGMGGSHLAADLLLLTNPSFPMTIHMDYGLPPIPKADAKKTLIIASSYSGNTEEVIHGLGVAIKQKRSVIVIAIGGALIDIAKKNNLPFIQLPNTGIQPRSALGFSFLALLKTVGDTKSVRAVQRLANILRPETLRPEAETLAKMLEHRVPVIYTSQTNRAIAYNWKIKLNETGKIPAFYNVFPELNHNEMTGFDVRDASKHLSEKFAFILLYDPKDHPRIQKRMTILETLYQDRGFPVTIVSLKGKTIFEKIFRSLLVADWLAVSLANMYGLESEQVPMVEEFKKLMTK